jgi:hypothetical protein
MPVGPSSVNGFFGQFTLIGCLAIYAGHIIIQTVSEHIHPPYVVQPGSVIAPLPGPADERFVEICNRRHSFMTAEASFVLVFDNRRTASTVGSSIRPEVSNRGSE